MQNKVLTLASAMEPNRIKLQIIPKYQVIQTFSSEISNFSH